MQNELTFTYNYPTHPVYELRQRRLAADLIGVRVEFSLYGGSQVQGYVQALGCDSAVESAAWYFMVGFCGKRPQRVYLEAIQKVAFLDHNNFCIELGGSYRHVDQDHRQEMYRVKAIHWFEVELNSVYMGTTLKLELWEFVSKYKQVDPVLARNIRGVQVQHG